MSAGIAVVLLDVSGRAKRYGRALAVDDLSFQVRASEIVGLVGPNGAGKTTVLRCCVGVLRPSAGAVRVCGYDSIVEASAARCQMAFVPELPSLYPLLTVAEQIEFIARSAPSSPKASRRACARRPPWWRPSCTGNAWHEQSPRGCAPDLAFCWFLAAKPPKTNKKIFRGWLCHPQTPAEGDFAHALTGHG